MTDSSPPSPLRTPVAVVLGLLAPPLGLFSWIAMSGARRADHLRSSWVRAGALVCAGSILPLLTVVVAARLGLWPDPNPNPIGLGLLLLVGGGLGTTLIAVGVVLVSQRSH